MRDAPHRWLERRHTHEKGFTMSTSDHETTDDTKRREPLAMPRLCSIALATAGILIALIFAGFVVGLILSLAIFVSGIFAHLESFRALKRAALQVKRDWPAKKMRAVTEHMKWYAIGNRRLDPSDPNKESEGTPLWWVIVVFFAGFGPLMVTMLAAPLMPVWLGLILAGGLIGLYAYTVIRMIRYGGFHPEPKTTSA